MIENTNKIYTLKQLLEEAKNGYFPFKSRVTISRLIEQKKLPAHFTKIGKTYNNWWFVGHELVTWLEKSKFKSSDK